MIEPDFPAKLVFPRALQLVSAAVFVALLAAFVVGISQGVARLA